MNSDTMLMIGLGLGVFGALVAFAWWAVSLSDRRQDDLIRSQLRATVNDQIHSLSAWWYHPEEPWYEEVFQTSLEGLKLNIQSYRSYC